MNTSRQGRLAGTPAWQALAAHADAMRGRGIAALFAADADRARRFAVDAAGLHMDYAKHLADAETIALLVRLARQQQVESWRERMFAGEPINHTEGRAVLHVALREPLAAARPDVRETRERMRAFVAAVQADPGITDVVNLGIGGSDLGPRMATHALRSSHAARPRVHFVANADPADFAAATRGLNPATTLCVVASKTFTTVETMSNVRLARAWGGRRFAAVTANVPAAQALGVPADRVFPMWDWVGGRYSLWSAVGLSLALAIGMDAFEELLAGAHRMDAHFRSAPLDRNLPVLLALLGVWYVNFHGAQSHAVLPYSEDLRELPAYLQQLEMESNGKRVDRDGSVVDHATCPVVWGAAGTNGQHAFHQLLHQGTPLVPCDFVVAAHPAAGEDAEAHRLLVANALAQSAALMAGKEDPLPHKAFPGDRPSTTLLIERLTPSTLGALLALYEHKVFVQGVIWNLNSFDQWGVELGKVIAKSLQPALQGAPLPDGLDASTAALVARLRQN
jgi:glucose-6-phosphate isomerase